MIADTEFFNTNFTLNEVLSNQIRLLIDYSLSEKSFIYRRAALQFETDELFKCEILIPNPNLEAGFDCQLKFQPLVYYVFVQTFKKEIEGIAFNNIDSINQFIKLTEEKLETWSTTQAKNQFIFELQEFLFAYSYYLEGFDLGSYAKSINKKDSHVDYYRFLNSLDKIFSLGKIQLQVIWEVLTSIGGQSEESEMYAFNFIIPYCSRNPAQTADLLNYSLLEPDSFFIKSIRCSFLQAFLKMNTENFKKLEEFFENSDLQDVIVAALSALELNDQTILFTWFNKVRNCSNNTQSYKLQLPSFYSSLLNNTNLVSDEIHELCISELKNLILNENVHINTQVVRQLFFIKQRDKEVIGLLTILVQSPNYNEGHSQYFNLVFINHLNISLFFSFFKAYSIVSKMKSSTTVFSNCIIPLRNTNEQEFDNLLITALIDDIGWIRYSSKKIAEFLAKYSTNYRYKVDIEKFPPLHQYKLLVSQLNTTSIYPEYNVPLLIPLLHCQNPIVKEAFICKLELLTKVYKIKLIKILEQHLDLITKEHKDAFDRINTYFEDYVSSIKRKSAIKELNPLYIENKWMKLYTGILEDEMKEKMTDSVQKNSIVAQFGNTIQIAKGGGWKHPTTGEISELKTVRAEVAFPNNYFPDPERYDLEFQMELISNWSSDFIELEPLLKE